MSEEHKTTISDLVGLPRSKYVLPHPRKKNLLHFGSFFENMAGIMMLPIYEDSLYRGEYYKTLSNDNINPDYVVFNNKEKKDLDIIIEVKSGSKNRSRDKKQAIRYFSKDVDVFYVLYSDKCSSLITDNASENYVITKVGFAPLLTDTRMYNIFSNKFEYLNFFDSLNVSSLEAKSAKSDLVKLTSILFDNLKNSSNINLSKIKTEFENVLGFIEKNYKGKKFYAFN
ncbi:MAG: hypothetical protein ACMXX6_00865 [Candidatus Woesearchaeota archaeon]